LRKTGRSVPKYPAKPSKRAPGETSLIGVGKPSSESGGPDFKVLIRDEAQGTIAECTTNELEDRIWNTLWDLWKTPDQNKPLRTANIIEALDKNVHIAGLKDPSGALLSMAGVPGASFWSSIVQQAPIYAVDNPLGSIKRLVLIGGIIVGFATGHLGMAYSCLKALLHSEAHRLSVAAIKHLLPGNQCNSTRGDESQPNRKYAAIAEAVRARRERAAARAELERIRKRQAAARVKRKQATRSEQRYLRGR
jgi:hypothetical protein